MATTLTPSKRRPQRRNEEDSLPDEAPQCPTSKRVRIMATEAIITSSPVQSEQTYDKIHAFVDSKQQTLEDAEIIQETNDQEVSQEQPHLKRSRRVSYDHGIISNNDEPHALATQNPRKSVLLKTPSVSSTYNHSNTTQSCGTILAPVVTPAVARVLLPADTNICSNDNTSSLIATALVDDSKTHVIANRNSLAVAVVKMNVFSKSPRADSEDDEDDDTLTMFQNHDALLSIDKEALERVIVWETRTKLFIVLVIVVLSLGAPFLFASNSPPTDSWKEGGDLVTPLLLNGAKTRDFLTSEEDGSIKTALAVPFLSFDDKEHISSRFDEDGSKDTNQEDLNHVQQDTVFNNDIDHEEIADNLVPRVDTTDEFGRNLIMKGQVEDTLVTSSAVVDNEQYEKQEKNSEASGKSNTVLARFIPVPEFSNGASPLTAPRTDTTGEQTPVESGFSATEKAGPEEIVDLDAIENAIMEKAANRLVLRGTIRQIEAVYVYFRHTIEGIVVKSHLATFMKLMVGWRTLQGQASYVLEREKGYFQQPDHAYCVSSIADNFESLMATKPVQKVDETMKESAMTSTTKLPPTRFPVWGRRHGVRG